MEVGVLDGGGADRRVITKGVSFSGDKNVLKLTVVTIAHICEYSKNNWIICFE